MSISWCSQSRLTHKAIRKRAKELLQAEQADTIVGYRNGEPYLHTS
jgi:hypothetical protein